LDTADYKMEVAKWQQERPFYFHCMHKMRSALLEGKAICNIRKSNRKHSSNVSRSIKFVYIALTSNQQPLIFTDILDALFYDERYNCKVIP